MQYEAPKFDEKQNPNISHDDNHLRELSHLVLYWSMTFVAIWLLVEALIFSLPYAVSLEREQRWFAFVENMVIDEHTQHNSQLQTLANQLAKHMDLPHNGVKVYVQKNDVKNAFATLGGHIVLYQGLLDELPDEESVAAVLAHEMAHVQHRDVLKSVSRGVLFSVVWSGLLGGGEQQMGLMLQLENLRYSRELENHADATAVRALQAHYGNVGGAIRLFQVLGKHDHHHLPQWSSTHPNTSERIAAVHNLSKKEGFVVDAPSRYPNIWLDKTIEK